VDFPKTETDRFIVDNCKNIYSAGYENTAVSATWTLMLLASNPEWQARVRAEVVQVCGGQMPDADMVRKMKTVRGIIFAIYKHSQPNIFSMTYLPSFTF
jgi:cytochrome P450